MFCPYVSAWLYKDLPKLYSFVISDFLFNKTIQQTQRREFDCYFVIWIHFTAGDLHFVIIIERKILSHVFNNQLENNLI